MLVIRAHHLLCLPRFQGVGYSRDFTANMARIAESLQKDPHQTVRVVKEPDAICACCPHRRDNCCALDSADSLATERDRRVLALVGLSSGDTACYSDLQAKLRPLMVSISLQGPCEGCRWLALCQRFAET